MTERYSTVAFFISSNGRGFSTAWIARRSPSRSISILTDCPGRYRPMDADDRLRRADRLIVDCEDNVPHSNTNSRRGRSTPHAEYPRAGFMLFQSHAEVSAAGKQFGLLTEQSHLHE